MAERSSDRAASVSSSVTEADNYDEKNGDSRSEGSFVKLKSPEELDVDDDVERAELLPQEPQPEKPNTTEGSVRSAAIWMVINTLATIGIVSGSISRRLYSF